MTTEEKAKRYDEAYKKVAIIFGSIVADEIFPELKESEDEMVRKALICRYQGDGCLCNNNYRIDYKEIRAWLEKQGEQKPAWSEDDDKYNYNIIIGVLKSQGASATSQDLLYERQINWLESLKDRVLTQPKFEWNEEDEDILNTIINHFEIDLECTKNDDIIKWLKSLKDRVQPQNKWKESLATANLENSLCDIQDGFSDTSYEYRILGEAIEFIRCTEPKPQWKPSDLPHWKKSTLPNDNTTGFNSDYFCYKGYNINYKELFEKLPKDD